jgi:hypothetical protein
VQDTLAAAPSIMVPERGIKQLTLRSLRLICADQCFIAQQCLEAAPEERLRSQTPGEWQDSDVFVRQLAECEVRPSACEQRQWDVIKQREARECALSGCCGHHKTDIKQMEPVKQLLSWQIAFSHCLMIGMCFEVLLNCKIDAPPTILVVIGRTCARKFKMKL